MDLQALRTFVAEAGQFLAGADELGISQQAVSKRVAALEKRLGVVLLVRTARGSRPSLDGQVFLPHAKKALANLEQAEHSVRPGSRTLRVDVLNRRIAPAQTVYDFFRSARGAALDAVTLADHNAAQAAGAVLDGSVDASFRAIPARGVPAGVRVERLLHGPLQLLVGLAHPLAREVAVRLADLVGYRIWIPGTRAGTEWAEFYEALADGFWLSVDALGPLFGDEALVDTPADSADLATLVGAGDRYLWPESYGLRRVPLVNPTPVYPQLLLSRAGYQHPVIDGLRKYLRATRPRVTGKAWAPAWVTV